MCSGERRAGEGTRPYGGYRNDCVLFVGTDPRPAYGRGKPLPYESQGSPPCLGRGVPWAPARIRTGGDGSAEPGAVLEPQQQQFLQTQGPVARIELRKATQILRAGNAAKFSRYASPVMGSGESGPMDLGGAKRSRSPSAASPVAFWLLCRHGQSNSPPAGGEIPCVP